MPPALPRNPVLPARPAVPSAPSRIACAATKLQLNSVWRKRCSSGAMSPESKCRFRRCRSRAVVPALCRRNRNAGGKFARSSFKPQSFRTHCVIRAGSARHPPRVARCALPLRIARCALREKGANILRDVNKQVFYGVL
jgi:hypothetical protein